MELAIMKPVLVQVGLTFFLLFWMAKERVQAIMSGTVIRNQDGVRPTWVGRAGTVSNAFHNQIEMPILFYAATAFAIGLNLVDDTLIALAWVYVGLRLVHAAIHTTYNKIPHRFAAYLVSNLVLAAIWVMIAIGVLGAQA